MTQGTQQQQPGREVAQRSALQTERGNTTIEQIVVAKVAGMAAQEIEGVHMGGGAARAFGGIVGNLPGGGSGGGGGQTRGVEVEVGQVEAAVNLALAVDYGKPIPQVSESVRRNVISRVENLVGLRVTEVNITVNDVLLPRPEQNNQQPAESQEARLR